MWCAYAFAVLALISLPDAIRPARPAIISWIAQTFLQLVLLSIIIVGQNILSAAADKRSEATYEDADAVLHEALQIQKHLEAQDRAIEPILARVGGPPGRPVPPRRPGAGRRRRPRVPRSDPGHVGEAGVVVEEGQLGRRRSGRCGAWPR